MAGPVCSHAGARLGGVLLATLFAACSVQTHAVASGAREAALLAAQRPQRPTLPPERRLPCQWSWNSVAETLTFAPRTIGFGGYEDLMSGGGDCFRYPVRAAFAEAMEDQFADLVEAPRAYPSEAYVFELNMTIVKVLHGGSESRSEAAEECKLEGTLAVLKPGRVPFLTYPLAATAKSPFVPLSERTVADAFWQAVAEVAKDAAQKVVADIATLEAPLRRDQWCCPIGPHFPVPAPAEGADDCPQGHRQRLRRYIQIVR